MKQLLLLVMIHVLVYHQYRKDKNETLAPKKSKLIKTIVLSYEEDYLLRGMEIYAKDSLLFSWQSKSPGYNYVNYLSWIK
jgi:hypothetical protein